MTQSIILEKLSKFIHTRRPDLAKYLVSQGFCQGFSVAYAAFLSQQKQEWWETLLYVVATSDVEHPESLECVIHLPQQERPQLLREIFERALNYIVPSQALKDPSVKDFLLDDQTQSFFEKDFQVVGLDKKIKKIQHKAVAAGNMTKEEIVNLFDEKMWAGKIGFAQNYKHVITIWYNEQNHKFCCYNSNYDHTCLETIHKEFAEKSKFVDEVISILGNAVNICVCSLDEKETVSFPSYVELIGPKLLNNNGMQNIYWDAPHLLLVQNKEGNTWFQIVAQFATNLLMEFSKRALEESKDGPEKIAQALRITNKIGKSGLDVLVDYAPSLIPGLINWAVTSPEGRNKIVELLFLQSKNKDTGLNIVACYAPALLPRLLDEIKSLGATDNLMSALALPGERNWTSLHAIIRYAPHCLPKIIELAAESKNGIYKISQALITQTSRGNTCLHLMSETRAISSLLPLLRMIAVSPEAEALVILALRLKNNGGDSALYIIRSDLDILINIFSLILKSTIPKEKIIEFLLSEHDSKEKGISTDTRLTPRCIPPVYSSRVIFAAESWLAKKSISILIKKNKAGISGLDLIVNYNLESLRGIIHTAVESNGTEEIFLLLRSLHKNNDTGLNIIARHVPDLLYKLLEKLESAFLSAIIKYPNRVDIIIQTLISKNENDKTGLNLIIERKPKLLDEIFRPLIDSKTNPEKIVQLLVSHHKDNDTGLGIIGFYAPKSLSSFLGFIKSTAAIERLVGVLATPGENNWTALHCIAHKAADSLPHVLNLAAESKEEINKFGDALIAQNKAGWTGFDMVAKFAIDCLLPMLTIIADSPSGPEKIGQALISRKNNGTTGLDSIEDKSALLNSVIELTLKSKEGVEKIVQLLLMKHKDNKTGLDIILPIISDILYKLLGLIVVTPENIRLFVSILKMLGDDEPCGPRKIFQTLMSKDKNGVSDLELIIKHDPDSLTDILKKGFNSKNIIDQIIKLLLFRISNNDTGLNVIAYFAPTALPLLLERIKSAGTIDSFIKALVSPGEYCWTGLHTISRYAPHCLPAVLELVAESKEGLNQLAKGLLLQTSGGGGTCLHIISENAKNSLLPLLRIIAKSPSGSEKIAEALIIKNKSDIASWESIAVNAPDSLANAIKLATESKSGARIIATDLLILYKTDKKTADKLLLSAPDVFRNLLQNNAEFIRVLSANQYSFFRCGENILKKCLETVSVKLEEKSISCLNNFKKFCSI